MNYNRALSTRPPSRLELPRLTRHPGHYSYHWTTFSPIATFNYYNAITFSIGQDGKPLRTNPHL